MQFQPLLSYIHLIKEQSAFASPKCGLKLTQKKGITPVLWPATNFDSDSFDARALYEDFYCARADMENRIKEQQQDLFADRTSTKAMARSACICSRSLRVSKSVCAVSASNWLKAVLTKMCLLGSSKTYRHGLCRETKKLS